MSKSSHQVRAYKIKHNYEISDFLESYRWLLQKAIDVIWENIKWVRKGRRIMPLIPKESDFKRYLRNGLLRNWGYCKHYVDSAIKQAYSILKSWRRNYIKGKRKRVKPLVKKKFVRVKETLYSFRDSKIKISVKPYEKYLEFDISRAWFWNRAKGEMGELILNERYLIITFRFRLRDKGDNGKIAWDLNKGSMDGFNPELGWIRVDLRELFHIHRVYERKRRRLQSIASRKPSLKRVLEKYSNREKNRARDFVHKLTTFLAKEFKDYVHGFEDLRKEKMFTRSKEHNREVSKSDWRMIQSIMAYKARVVYLDPKNTSKRCSRCGMVNAPKGALYECSCGLRINRHLNAAINLYLQMEGLTPSPRFFGELMRARRGFTLTGEEADEGLNELERVPRLVNPKSYVRLRSSEPSKHWRILSFKVT